MHQSDEPADLEFSDDSLDTIQHLKGYKLLDEHTLKYARDNPKITQILLIALHELQGIILEKPNFFHYKVQYIQDPDSEKEEILIKVYLKEVSAGLNLEIRKELSKLLDHVVREHTSGNDEFISARAKIGILIRGVD